jgi:uncharacterized protein (DUF2141 family)
MTNNRTVGTQATTLSSNESQTLTFVWNTSGIPPANYTIAAAATILANNFTAEAQAPQVYVRIVGDVNGDGKVDMNDIGTAARAFGSQPGDLKWNPDCDLNHDGKIDLKDIGLTARNFGQHCA